MTDDRYPSRQFWASAEAAARMFPVAAADLIAKCRDIEVSMFWELPTEWPGVPMERKLELRSTSDCATFEELDYYLCARGAMASMAVGTLADRHRRTVGLLHPRNYSVWSVDGIPQDAQFVSPPTFPGEYDLPMLTVDPRRPPLWVLRKADGTWTLDDPQ